MDNPSSMIDFSLYRGVHIGIEVLLRASGFTFEKRRYGDVFMGIWRRQIGKKGAQAKRFVVFPGLGDTSASWMPTIISLIPWLIKREYTEICVLDYPGFPGHLSRYPVIHSMDLLRSVADSTLATLKPHTVVGHSLGGWLGTHYALHSGAQTLKELCLIAPSGVYGSEESLAKWFKYFEGVTEIGFPEVKRVLVSEKSSKIWNQGLKLFERDFQKFFKGEDLKALLRSVKQTHFFNDRVSEIGARVTLLWGQYDEMVFTQWIETWTEKVPHASALILKGFAHSPQMQNPFLVSRAIRSLLEQDFANRDQSKAFQWVRV